MSTRVGDVKNMIDKAKLISGVTCGIFSVLLFALVGCTEITTQPAPGEPSATHVKSKPWSPEASEPTGAAAEQASREYLLGTVEPCTRKFGGIEPCVHPTQQSEGSVVEAHSGEPFDPLDIDDVVAHDLINSDGASVAHMVVRGILLPGTTRCGVYPYHPPRSENAFTSSSPWVVCYVDSQVHDYIVGKGPEKLTLSVSGRLILDAFSHDDFPNQIELAEMVKDSQAEQIAGIEDMLIGREWVVGINPSSNIAQLAWNPVSVFPVERADDGEVRVVSRWLRFMRADGDEITDEHRDHLSWPLDEFERRAVAFHENRPEKSGVGWDYLPATILTDAYDIHKYFDEELRPYYEPHDLVPATPGPAPGELHSHPAAVEILLESTEP
ncbi:MAG: hypothetical protein F4Y63_09950 [Chloroflexi bacterium]|nr:hypothetical protein [Chloroflexota bacterium]MYF78926.1 hypothetical protein [Chloroflexota bacterium]MYK62141.1 hypothetical protein [Chloroflexota bacterium]